MIDIQVSKRCSWSVLLRRNQPAFKEEKAFSGLKFFMKSRQQFIFHCRRFPLINFIQFPFATLLPRFFHQCNFFKENYNSQKGRLFWFSVEKRFDSPPVEFFATVPFFEQFGVAILGVLIFLVSAREKCPTLTVASFFFFFFRQTTDLIAYVPLFTEFTLAHMYSVVLGLR